MARLAERDAERDAELERLRADFAVLQRMLFGRSSEKSRPGPWPAAMVMPLVAAGRTGNGGRLGKEARPGGAGGAADYSRLPRLEVFWDFPDGGYCCPECGEPFTPLGDHLSGEQLDWQVIVRLAAHCRRRYRRACDCLCRSNNRLSG